MRPSALVVLGVLALAPVPARAQPTDGPAPGAVEYERGQVAYDLGRYAEAIEAWEQSYALSKHTLLLFNLGQAARLAGDCRRAVGYYRAFLRASPEAPQAADAESFVNQLGTCPERVEPPIDTGAETAAQLAPPPASMPAPVPEPAQAPARDPLTRIVAPALAATGAVSIAAGVYLGRRAEAEAREVTDLCTTRCEWSEVEARDASGRRAETLQWVAYGLGAAAIAGAVTTYHVGRRRDRARASVAMHPRRGGGMLTLEGSW